MEAVPQRAVRSAEPDCKGQNTTAERLERAVSLCRARGARITEMRRRVLTLLYENERPMGAYELIDALKRQANKNIGPPTAYRALEFLISEGLAAKIESQNAYVACADRVCQHDRLFFVCTSCGEVVEWEDQRLERLISEYSYRAEFQPKRAVVEINGTCRTCTAAETAPT